MPLRPVRDDEVEAFWRAGDDVLSSRPGAPAGDRRAGLVPGEPHDPAVRSPAWPRS